MVARGRVGEVRQDCSDGRLIRTTAAPSGSYGRRRRYRSHATSATAPPTTAPGTSAQRQPSPAPVATSGSRDSESTSSPRAPSAAWASRWTQRGIQRGLDGTRSVTWALSSHRADPSRIAAGPLAPIPDGSPAQIARSVRSLLAAVSEQNAPRLSANGFLNEVHAERQIWRGSTPRLTTWAGVTTGRRPSARADVVRDGSREGGWRIGWRGRGSTSGGMSMAGRRRDELRSVPWSLQCSRVSTRRPKGGVPATSCPDEPPEGGSQLFSGRSLAAFLQGMADDDRPSQPVAP